MRPIRNKKYDVILKGDRWFVVNTRTFEFVSKEGHEMLHEALEFLRTLEGAKDD